MTRLADRLPDFPWDRLAPYQAIAAQHPDGIVDLSVGTPVDPVPQVIRDALDAASDSPGYPLTAGTVALREAASAWAARTLRAAVDPDAILPTVGSKELVALLPTLLGLGPQDVVVIPELAYPTYDVGAQVAGCQVVVSDSTHALGPQRVSLVWVNSPSNPTGRVLPAEHLAKVVAWARERDAIVVSDECYLELAWDAAPVSILDERVCGGTFENLLAVHSLSKPSRATAPGSCSATASWSGRCWRRGRTSVSWCRCPSRRPRPPRSPTTCTSSSSATATPGGATTCSRPCSTPASPSSTPRPGSTCG